MAGGKRALTYYLGAVPTYSMIYGAFATLPIFLVWIYLSWLVVLLGAVIAAYAPLVGKRIARWPDAPGADFHLALLILAMLDQARKSERRGYRADELALAIGTDPLQVDDVLNTLVEIDWAGRLEESGNARYVMLCDPAATTAEPLVARLLLDPSPDLAPVWQRAGFGRLRLAEILAAPGASA
jgi:membrane protein